MTTVVPGGVCARVREQVDQHLCSRSASPGSLGTSPAPDVEVVATDALERVHAPEAEPGLDLWLVGGGTLAHALLPEIDRLVRKQNPSVIGSGVPLFRGPFQPHLFRPVDQHLLESGVRVLTYDRAQGADATCGSSKDDVGTR